MKQGNRPIPKEMQMNRCKDFLEMLSEEMPGDTENVYRDIMIDFLENKERYIADFIKVIETAFAQCIQKQNDGLKGPAECILISPSLYGVYTGSYDVIINVFDERLFEDTAESIAYWNADFVYCHINAHMPIITEFLKKKFVNVRNYEIEEFRRIYAMMFQEFLNLPILHLTEAIETSKLFASLEKNDVVHILYGPYMDECTSIRTISLEGKI